MLWHEQSWPRLEAIDKDTPVMIPLGSCEQHGRHLPLFVDTIQVTTIAERIERELADGLLLLPTVWIGASHHHKDFPGTISVLPSLYSRTIRSLAQCILRAGFRRLLFVNGHGGNHVPVAQALTELVSEDDRADDAYLVLSTWWETNRHVMAPERHGMTSPKVTHACEYETSVMLAIRPDLVHLDHAGQASPALDNRWVRTENEYGSRVAIFRRFHRLSASGSLGNPTAATAGKGRSILDAVVPEMCALVRDMRSWPAMPVRHRSEAAELGTGRKEAEGTP